DRDLMQDAMGPQIESDRRKVRIDFEAGRATSRSASGLFSFLCNAICCLCIAIRLEMYWLVMDREGAMFCVLRALVLLGLLVRFSVYC
ncbi:MAG: hypothetical protein ACR2N1_09495, partial [Rubripirellula sp.]